MNTLNLLILVATVLTALPGLGYLLGRFRDPFHPLIFVSALFFMMSAFGVLSGLHRVNSIISYDATVVFLVVACLSVLGFYAGWALHWRSQRLVEAAVEIPAGEYDPSRLLGWAVLFDVIGVTAYLYTRHEYTVTAYLRDFGSLWIIGAFMSVQVILLAPRLRVAAFLTLAVALIPPLDRFFDYGQRGDTFRMAVICLPFFLFKRVRPKRMHFIPFALGLLVLMGTLDRTRTLIGEGEATNRVDALVKVIPSMLQQRKEGNFQADESWVFGAGMIQAAREEGSYEYGAWLYNIGVRFLPKELFDKDRYYTQWNASSYIKKTSENMSFPIPNGSAPTGAAHVFLEFAWAAPLFWMALGAFFRKRYIHATATGDLAQHVFLAGLYIVTLYLITQDLYACTMNSIYIFPAMAVAYKTSRLSVSSAVTPELATV